MACNLLSRLFRRRNRRLPVSAHHCSPPSLPARFDKLQLQLSHEQLDLQVDLVGTDHKEDDACFFPARFSEQSTCVTAISGISSGTDNTYLHQPQGLPESTGFEGGTPTDTAVNIDILVHSSTAADAIDAVSAVATQPTITLARDSSHRSQITEAIREGTMEPSAKRQKLEQPPIPLLKCNVCSEDIVGPYVKACFYCDMRWCHDCLKGLFATALTDQERFPIQCCARIVHFDVARGIISDSEYNTYKSRFEERSTTQPVYCADPECSQFLPPRLSAPYEEDLIRCFACEKTTCGQCRIIVGSREAENHVCTVADEMMALMKQFEYKRCPCCSAGVAKMYGCEHVRCQCGAHWCWECQRPIQICWAKPCARSREDGYEPDNNDAREEEGDDDEESISETLPANPAQRIPANQTSVQQEARSTSTSGNEAQLESSLRDDPFVEPSPVDSASEANDEPNAASPATNLQGPSAESPSNGPVTNADMLARLIPAQMHNPPVDTSESSANTPLEYRPPACLAPTPQPPVQPAPALSAKMTELINLDADDFDEWEAGSYDFGDEPVDESWDVWGCHHHFAPVENAAIHECWLSSTTDPKTLQSMKQIDCLRCYKTITLNSPIPGKNEVDKSKDYPDEVSSVNSFEVNETIPVPSTATASTESDKKVKKKQKSKNQANTPKVFNCSHCGVFYCRECKRTAIKELSTALERTAVER